MCGIIGYAGSRSAVGVLIEGLKNLEYRGYDSSGIAVADGTHLFLEKKAGKLENLERSLLKKRVEGKCGIGHTRWATHGAATDENAHPFFSRYAKFAVVHNGIITNYLELARFLRERGVCLSSDTDSEVVAHLIDFYYTGDVLSATLRAVKDLTGSFALGVVSVYEKEVVYGVRKDSPLLAGEGKNGNYICSDLSGISEDCEKYYALSNGEVARITPREIRLFGFDGKERAFRPEKTSEFERAFGAKDAESFMLSEIREVPTSLSSALESYPEEEMKRLLRENFGRFCLIGCGSAYHAALSFKAAMRELCGVRTEDSVASEFLTERWEGGDRPLVIAVSQSGETADTLKAALKAKEKGAKVLCVCNVRSSSLVRLSDAAILTRCGAERAVAATKSYAAQVIALLRLALTYAEISGKMTKKDLERYKEEIFLLPEKAREALKLEKSVAELCLRVKDAKAVFFLGRNADYYSAKEGSLKLKEISYLPSESYPSGELKHGTLALMEKGVYAFMISTNPALKEKNASSLAEVKARGAQTIVVTNEDRAEDFGADRFLRIPKCPAVFSPAVSCVATQLFSYYIAKYRGCDADKPRNLAKSVTVE